METKKQTAVKGEARIKPPHIGPRPRIISSGDGSYNKKFKGEHRGSTRKK